MHFRKLREIQDVNTSLVLTERKRRINVHASKLPHDFFKKKYVNSINYFASEQILEDHSTAENSPRVCGTPSFGKLPLNRIRSQKKQNRKAETARQSSENDCDLITQIISTSRNLNRALRKQSLELRRSQQKQIDFESISKFDRLPRLPLITNRRYSRPSKLLE